jgi:hypothetical protein
MKKYIIVLCALIALAACEQKEPLSQIDEGTRYFLFGDDESRISFMGIPADNGIARCDPTNMQQAYGLRQGDAGVFIESVRPSGVERHIVRAINGDKAKITIRAKNNANLPFTLVFTNINETGADISFDDTPKQHYARCLR